MGVIKTYCFQFASVVAPTIMANSTFQINNTNRQFKLKSIILDTRFIDSVSGNVLPMLNNTTQQIELLITSMPAGNLFTQPVGNIVFFPGSIMQYNGNGLSIFTPGQYHFNGCDQQNNMQFAWWHQNNDVLITYNVLVNIVIETEEVIIKYAK